MDPLWDDITNGIQLELWKYPPALFGRNGKVDPISLYCSLKDTPDERIENELETMLEEMASGYCCRWNDRHRKDAQILEAVIKD